MNTENAEINEGLIRFDIVFYVRLKDGVSKVIVNVEMQKNEPEEYQILNRVLFYVCRLISSQKERDFTHSNYDDIKRVYSIWICMDMDENSLSHIHLTKDDWIGAYPLKGDMGLLNIVMIGLTSTPPEREEGYELHRLLSTLLSMELSPEEKLGILKDEYHITKDEEREEEVNIMGSLSEGIWEKGIKQGRQEGLERGESKVATLFRILLSADRIDDLRRASEDSDYRKELYEEYGIE